MHVDPAHSTMKLILDALHSVHRNGHVADLLRHSLLQLTHDVTDALLHYEFHVVPNTRCITAQ